MKLKRLLPAAFTLLAIAAAVAVWPQAAAHWPPLDRVPAGAWVAGVAGMLASYACRGMRIRAEWKGRYPLSAAHAIELTLLHIAAINVVPMRAGELGYPLMLNRRFGVPFADAATSLAWMRFQDVTLLGSLVVAGGAVLFAMLGRLPWAVAIAAVLAMVLLVAALVLRAARWGNAAQAWWAARKPAPHRARWLGLLHTGFAAVLAASARNKAATWGWSLASWGVKVVSLSVLLSAVAGIGTAAGLCGVLGGEIAGALPVQPQSGFGTYEAGAALAASACSAAPWARLLGAALVVHLVMLGTSLAGAGVAWLLVKPAPQRSGTEGGA
jgi:hypothetical protein